ncbi:Nitroreductase [Cyclonatronum proteinivorum]|uniref:Nitroreductase n=1 Tax=Cyclonatronum proteinivorum TaxID=1457365 RepID=A0A345UML7_9BACT|nr:Nitroreductase [Cyclonatronum proteinivorum]
MFKTVDRFLIRWCSRSLIGSRLYYTFFSNAFAAQQQAVLKGRATFNTPETIGRLHSSANLRRNIHRLEKGLAMKGRREVFAASYIQQTVREYKEYAAAGFETAERLWAQEVLDTYFEAVSHSDPVAQAFALYRTVLRTEAGHRTFSFNPQCAPYAFEVIRDAEVSFEDFQQLCEKRRSVRWFLPRSVPDEAVQKLVSTALLAPSACNRQPFRFICARERAAAVAACAAGTTGYVHQLPAVLVVAGDYANYGHERDKNLIYIDASLAAMQLMLAAPTLGLASCPINWAEDPAAESRIRKLIDLKDSERIIMLIALGYPEPGGMIPYSQKKQAAQVLTYADD